MQMTQAKNVQNLRFYILMLDDVLSIVFKSDIYVLKKFDDHYLVQQIRFQLPKKGSKSKESYFKLDYKILVSITLPDVLNDIKYLFYVPYPGMLGCLNIDKSSHIISLGSKMVDGVFPLKVESEVKPFVAVDGKMLCWSTSSNFSLYHISVERKSVSIEQVDQLDVDGRVHAFTLKGKVVSAARYSSNQFSIVELGSLYFGVLFCEAITRLYHAISYMHPWW